MKISNFWYVVIFSVFSSLVTGTVMLWSFSKLNFTNSSFENFDLSKKAENGLCVTGKSEDEILYGKYLLNNMSGVLLKRVSDDVLIARNIDGYEAIDTNTQRGIWSHHANRWYGGFINNAVISSTMFIADQGDDGKSLTLTAVNIKTGWLWKKTLIETGFQGKEKRLVVLSKNDSLYIISYKQEFIAGCEQEPCDAFEQAIRDNAAGDVNYVFKINPETGSVVWKKQFLNKNEVVSISNGIKEAYFENNYLKFSGYVAGSESQYSYEYSFDLTDGTMIKKNIE